MTKQFILTAIAAFAFAVATTGLPVTNAGVLGPTQAHAWNPIKAVKKAAKKVGGAVKKGAKAVGGAGNVPKSGSIIIGPTRSPVK